MLHEISIRTKNVSFSRKRDFEMKNVSARIPEGKITTLIGPNGSGKSTMLRLMMRLLTPDSGEIFLNDKNITEIPSKDLAKNDDAITSSRRFGRCDGA